MPKISPASTSRRMTVRSSELGLTSPEGWLCASRTLAAEAFTAGLKISRGWTSEELRVPTEIVGEAMTRFLVSSRITMKVSRSR